MYESSNSQCESSRGEKDKDLEIGGTKNRVSKIDET